VQQIIKKRRKTKLYIASAIISLILIFGGYLVWYLNQDATVSGIEKSDNQLVAKAAKLGIDVSGFSMQYGIVESAPAHYSKNKVVVRQSGEDRAETTAVAYGYLKYVLNEKAESREIEAIQPQLESLYQRSPALRQLVDTHSCEPKSNCFYHEVLAAGCTQIPASELTNRLNAWCDFWIPGRYSVLKL
jgi:hypothetical protein